MAVGKKQQPNVQYTLCMTAMLLSSLLLNSEYWAAAERQEMSVVGFSHFSLNR